MLVNFGWFEANDILCLIVFLFNLINLSRQKQKENKVLDQGELVDKRLLLEEINFGSTVGVQRSMTQQRETKEEKLWLR